MRVHIAQVAPKLGLWEANFALHVQLLAEASATGAQVVVFPELSLTGYQLKDLVSELALPVSSLVDRFAKATAGKIKDLEAVVGFVEEGDGVRFYNSSAVLAWDNQGSLSLRHCHRKVYLPTYGLFDELRYFAAGQRIRAYDSNHLGRAGVLICEDAWHLAVSYILSLDGPDHAGAQALIVVANSPSRGVGPSEDGIMDNLRFWQYLNRTYAGLLGCVVINCLRVGVEDGLIFSGGSEVVAPTGDVLGQAPVLDEHILVVDYDSHELLRRHRVRNPVGAVEDLDLTLRELERIRSMELGS